MFGPAYNVHRRANTGGPSSRTRVEPVSGTLLGSVLAAWFILGVTLRYARG